jgi:hypothetical protein
MAVLATALQDGRDVFREGHLGLSRGLFGIKTAWCGHAHHYGAAQRDPEGHAPAESLSYSHLIRSYTFPPTDNALSEGIGAFDGCQ